MRRLLAVFSTLFAAAGGYCVWRYLETGHDSGVLGVGDLFLFLGIAGIGYGLALLIGNRLRYALMAFAAGAISLFARGMTPEERLVIIVGGAITLAAAVIGLQAIFGKGPAASSHKPEPKG